MPLGDVMSEFTNQRSVKYGLNYLYSFNWLTQLPCQIRKCHQRLFLITWAKYLCIFCGKDIFQPCQSKFLILCHRRRCCQLRPSSTISLTCEIWVVSGREWSTLSPKPLLPSKHSCLYGNTSVVESSLTGTFSASFLKKIFSQFTTFYMNVKVKTKNIMFYFRTFKYCICNNVTML